MRRTRYAFAFFAALVWISFRPLPASLAAEPIVTTDLLRIRSVDAIDVSRDGTRAVIAVRSIAAVHADTFSDRQDSQPQTQPTTAAQPAASALVESNESRRQYKYQSHLYLIDLTAATAAPRQITFGPRRDGSPRLSPDGRRIAFVRQPENGEAPASGGESRHGHVRRSPRASASPQLWIIPVDGGEARQVTAFDNGCENPLWSPDGRRILVSADVSMNDLEGVPAWPTERPKRNWKDAALPDGVHPNPAGTRAQIRAWLERNADDQNPVVIDRLEFQDELALRDAMRFRHLFMVNPDEPNIDSAPSTVSREQAQRITSGFFDHTQPAFFPDGQSIAYVSKKPTDQHVDRLLATSLWRVNADGSNDRPLISLADWTLSAPRPSRDGSVVAFTATRIDEPAFRQTQLAMASIKDDGAGEPVWLTDEATFVGSVGSFDWMQAQPALVFSTALRGSFPLMSVSPGTIQPAMIVGDSDGKPAGINVFAIGGGSIVYSVSTASNPCVLKARDARGERLVYDLNPWVRDKTLSAPVESALTRPDGAKIQWWLMEPTNREPGRKYPLVLEMHGGPSAMWGPGEFTMWHEFQLLCSWGFGVVYANPRGSGGYGYEFQKLNFQDWGQGPAGDVLAAVDDAVQKDWVDREKLLVTGGSYAGYLTAWIVAHDNRFKAAVAQRGVYHFDAFFGEGNAWRLVGWAMGGVPYDQRFRPVLDRNNIWSHVQRIRTPLLIMHASNDLRTGVSQSEMLYRALKDMNKPVEYVRYPNAGHDLSRTGDPVQRMDRLNRIIEFFERYVENPRVAPTAN